MTKLKNSGIKESPCLTPLFTQIFLDKISVEFPLLKLYSYIYCDV
jgi:hypothetical protein